MKKVWMLALVLLSAGLWVATSATAGEGRDGSQSYAKFHGKVTAVNADNSTITFTNKEDESQTFTIPETATIEINGKAGTLGDITLDMYGAVKLNNGTPIKLKAWTHGTRDKSKPNQ